MRSSLWKLGAPALLLVAVGAGVVPLALAQSTTSSGGAAQAALPIVYAKRDGSEIRSGTGRLDPVVARVNMGTALSLIQRDAVRSKVRTSNGVEGWISALNISTTQPRATSQGVAILRDDTGPGERSGVASIRGLSPLSAEYAAAENIPVEFVEQVKEMEAVGDGISEAEVSEFKSTGGVVAP